MPNGVPRVPAKKKKPKPRQPAPKKVCVSCPTDVASKPLTQFYKTNGDLYSDNLLPICKLCIKDRCLDSEKNEIRLEEFKKLLRQFDKPYIEMAYQAAIKEFSKRYPLGEDFRSDIDKSNIIGYYFKNILSMPQYKNLNWEQGIQYENTIGSSSDNQVHTKRVKSDIVNGKDSTLYYLEDDGFEVTQDIIKLFGEGYQKSEYRAMWKKYDFIKKNYSDTTNLHSEALLTYVRFKVKEEMATALGDVVEAEKWSKAATTAAEKAKINPSQLTKSDLQGGLNSFSELLLTVEQAVDIIPILPRFKFRPNDAIDFTILCYVNYLRDLEGKPLCEYEDLYKFYDERKHEHIEQHGDPYGIFTDDPTESNRDNIKKFITLPNDYREIEVKTEEGDDVIL